MTGVVHRPPHLSPRPFGMKEVARLAGVSHTTVWRVFNDHRGVQAETRERVHHAIRQLGYRLNPAARTLVTQRSNTLGIITADSASYATTSILRGFERAARSAGYFVTITSAETTPDEFDKAVNRLCDQGVDGALTLVPPPATTARGPDPFPIVSIGSRRRRTAGIVSVDTATAATMATAYLLELGHATVHHVSGPLRSPEARRLRGAWQRSLRTAGAHQPPSVAGDWTARSGYELGLRLASDTTVTAVFCANDQMAIGTLRAMTESNRHVPDDVSIIGVGDIPAAAYTTPPLTSIRQNLDALGAHCMAVLDTLVTHAEQTDPARHDLASTLIIRGSTPPARTPYCRGRDGAAPPPDIGPGAAGRVGSGVDRSPD